MCTITLALVPESFGGCECAFEWFEAAPSNPAQHPHFNYR
jgi:hypothetical protein